MAGTEARAGEAAAGAKLPVAVSVAAAAFASAGCLRAVETPVASVQLGATPRPRFLHRYSTWHICPQTYPAFCVPLPALLKMDTLRPHQELLAAGLLESVQPGDGKVVIFVSHQWLGYDHPDEHGRQLRVLQGSLTNLLEGRAKVEMDFALEFKSMVFDIQGVDLGANFDAQSGSSELAEAYVWLDYLSVPQPGAAWSEEERAELASEMQLAVNSIVAYIQLASYFVVLAPPLAHEDRPSEVLDYGTWTRRGWCIVERMTWALSKHSHSKVMLLVEEANRVIAVSSRLENDACGLHSAQWTNRRDCDQLAPIMQSLLKRKLSALYDSGELDEYRSMLGLWPRLLQDGVNRTVGFVHSTPSDSDAPDSEDRAAVFLESCCLRVATQRDGLGRTPLHLAAACGDAVGVRTLLAQRANPSAATTKCALHSLLPPGSTPLHATALCVGAREEAATVLDLLIAARASVNGDPSCRKAMPPITMAAASNNCQALELLLDRRADAQHYHPFWDRPLTVACNCSCRRAVELLLSRRASPHTHNYMGLTPAHSAVLMVGSASEVLPCLAASGVDLDAKAAPRKGWRLLRAGLHVAWGLGWRKKIAAVAKARDATPLMVAAMVGNVQGVAALVAARADVATRNCEGKTAYDLARQWGTMGHEALGMLQVAPPAESVGAERGGGSAAAAGSGRRAPPDGERNRRSGALRRFLPCWCCLGGTGWARWHF